MARAIAKDARERARAAKRRVDAERAERDKLIEDAATAYYESAAIIDEATAQMHAAVNTLLNDLQEPVSRVATLLDLDPKELGKLKKAVTKSSPKDSSKPSPVASEHEVATDSVGHASESQSTAPHAPAETEQPAAGTVPAGAAEQTTVSSHSVPVTA